MSRKVLIGMSGGVDSSVAAARLVEAGHEVIGVSLQLFDQSDGGHLSRCCSPEEFKEARKVAATLGFPYYVVNREELFDTYVLEDFVREYGRGRTPNPCVRCNAHVKFDTLFRLAADLGAERIATGHYARLIDDGGSRSPILARARDAEKDQSYFLFDVRREHLSRTLFPLGDMSKFAVRETARRLGLSTADKPESQDVCFVVDGDYRSFLSKRMIRSGVKEHAGAIVDRMGRKLGSHDGISAYTIGQRKGLGIATGRRLYVIDIDAERSDVVVGDAEELLCHGVELNDTTLQDERQTNPFDATVRLRYRHAGEPARIVLHDSGRASVAFSHPVRGVSPGQAAVFYDGEHVLGGGWIRSSVRSLILSSRRDATCRRADA